MSLNELAADVGLAALGLLTLNILFGLSLSTRIDPFRRWPQRKIRLFTLHNWTAYIALALAVAHPALIVLDERAGFRVIDVLVPLWSPAQPVENTLGAIALYGIVFVVVTSYFRKRLGRRRWKAMHFVSYAAAGLFFLHGILTDPSLKNAPIDPFDAEKVFVEACIVVVMVSSLLRVRYALRAPG